MAWKFNTIPPKRLSETINASSTSFKLSDILGFDGVSLTETIIGDTGYGTFQNPDGSIVELFEFDTATIADSNGIDFVKRGLTVNEDGLFVEVSSNKRTWVKGTTIVNIGTNPPALFAALKNYIDGIAIAGSPNASQTAKGLVEIATAAQINAGTATGETGAAIATTPDQLALSIYGTRLPSSDEKAALAGGSAFGTPSSSNKFITQDYLSSASSLPVVRTYTTAATKLGGATTRFDITNISGSTYRYTYDGTGTNPNITSITVPVGAFVTILSISISSGNQGTFTVTGSGTNYFEVTNASGVAENDKTIDEQGVLAVQDLSWTKPAGLKYIRIKGVGGGEGGGGADASPNSNRGGAAGAYFEKLIPAASLASTEKIIIGTSGSGGVGVGAVADNGQYGGTTKFGSHCTATGGKGIVGGTATGGDINLSGENGGSTVNVASTAHSGKGGNSPWGLGTGGFPGVIPSASAGAVTGGNGFGYGSGGGGAARGSSSEAPGGNGAQGYLEVLEFYS